MSAMTASQLKLSGVTSGYGRVTIVSGISLEVATAEIVAVIGRNGVGKTTLIKTIMGDIPVSAGTLAFRQIDITRLGAPRRARLGIGYVPQGRGIFARMSVKANLSLGANVGSAEAPNYERAFQFFPILKDRLPQLAGSMSGGEQQQLAIGRVLVGQPDIMLLDEPSEGIQPNIVQEIGRTIRRLRDEEGLTILMVEQNLALIRAVADRCVVIDKGAVVATLPPEALDDPETAQRYLAI
jgi:branched-chain amino acid transport system ATP-binding protein